MSNSRSNQRRSLKLCGFKKSGGGGIAEIKAHTDVIHCPVITFACKEFERETLLAKIAWPCSHRIYVPEKSLETPLEIWDS